DLVDEAMMVNYADEESEIRSDFKERKNTLVIFTPAIPKDHKQHQFFKDGDFEILKRAEVLGLITKNIYTLAVAGTHGKTTTTAILGHLLNETGAKVTAFLGGI